ncbi:MAG: leucine-rich repeat protein, partial [Bacteroidales bacterium]|nr:leucine-rich repeat protein [Candidatus Colimorpha onthohippi]
PALPHGLTTIGNNAFQNCGNIGGNLLFPATITSIGGHVFDGCAPITQIRMLATTPPAITATSFATAATTTPVIVPCGSMLRYYITNNWENFSNMSEGAPFAITTRSNNEVMGDADVAQEPTCDNHNALIHATPHEGYHFLQWSDGNAANPRLVSLTSDSSFEAQFVPNQSYITVNSNDPTMGSVSGGGTYNYRSPVTLVATPNVDYHFQRWSDGSTQNPRYLSATEDAHYTAFFLSNVSSIAVGNNNPEMGTVSGSGVFYYKNRVVVSATPHYGYHFTQWDDGDPQNPRTVEVSQDSVFRANFAVNIYAVSATGNKSAMGSVSGSGNYNYLSAAAVTANASLGYHFVQWNDGNTNNPRNFTVESDTSFVAQFAANDYAISATANDPQMGSVFGGGTYKYGSNATLSASATYGYHFGQWSDGNTENPRTVTVTGRANYTAQFVINTYTIATESSAPALGTASGGGSYAYGSRVSVEATPAYGYHFAQWNDGNTENPRTIAVTRNATYMAQFAINNYSVVVASRNASQGSVAGGGTYSYNSQVTLSATPTYGYHFAQWSDGNTSNPRSFAIENNITLEAQFDYNRYEITTRSSNLAQGDVTGGGTYLYTSQVVLQATSKPHYHFVDWNDGNTINPRTVTVQCDSVFTARFAIDTHQILVRSLDTAMGNVTGTGAYAYNSAIYIAATPHYGYHFVRWNDGNTSDRRRVIVTNETMFTATFAPNTYTATVTSDDIVLGIVSGSTTTTYLTSITISATSRYGYHFVQWSDGDTNNPRQLTLTQDTFLNATFALNTYQITLHSNNPTYGSVHGDGQYLYKTNTTLTASPNIHYHFVQWSDGNTSNPRLLTVVVDADYTAQFAEDERFVVRVTANDTARGEVSGGGNYYNGEQITIRATANDHYYFDQWSDGSSANPRVMVVIGDATYTANFLPNTYVLTVVSNDYAKGSATGGGTYDYGTAVTLTATAYPGACFTRWNDGNTNATRTVTVEDNAYYQAIFNACSTDGIDEVTAKCRIITGEKQVVVEGAEGRSLRLYDVMGRTISQIERCGSTEHIQVPHRGVYLLQIQDHPAQKIVF